MILEKWRDHLALLRIKEAGEFPGEAGYPETMEEGRDGKGGEIVACSLERRSNAPYFGTFLPHACGHVGMESPCKKPQYAYSSLPFLSFFLHRNCLGADQRAQKNQPYFENEEEGFVK